MKDNRIESFSALEGALNNLQQLSNEVSNTFNQISSTYDTQQEGWASANSTSQQNKMMDYAGEAQKIAKNINEVSEAVQKFKTTTQSIDEQN